MLILFLIFAVFHSGMASLRDAGEKLIGERAFRVIFAGISLPLAVTTVVSFCYFDLIMEEQKLIQNLLICPSMES